MLFNNLVFPHIKILIIITIKRFYNYYDRVLKQHVNQHVIKAFGRAQCF